MQIQLDPLMVYHGSTRSLFNEDSSLNVVDVRGIQLNAEGIADNKNYYFDYVRKKDDDVEILTIYVHDRNVAKDFIVLYVEFHLGTHKFHTYVHPQYRHKFPVLVLELLFV